MTSHEAETEAPAPQPQEAPGRRQFAPSFGGSAAGMSMVGGLEGHTSSALSQEALVPRISRPFAARVTLVKFTDVFTGRVRH